MFNVFGLNVECFSDKVLNVFDWMLNGALRECQLFFWLNVRKCWLRVQCDFDYMLHVCLITCWIFVWLNVKCAFDEMLCLIKC
jgi:hypothetical protein